MADTQTVSVMPVPSHTLTFLGTGTSTGVPLIGCDCPVCASSNPLDQRLRCSALAEWGEVKILLDCGPDFRAQALHHHITALDAILITHEHYDHVGGLDDIRPLGNMPIYAEQRVLSTIQRNMPYCFGENHYPGSPTLTLHEVIPQKSFQIASLMITPLRVLHGKLPIIGYRIENFAYITDASAIDEDTIVLLQGIDTLVLNALQLPSHPAHFSLEESLAVAEKIGARTTYFTHFSHHIGLHTDTSRMLPDNIHLAYDNLTINL